MPSFAPIVLALLVSFALVFVALALLVQRKWRLKLARLRQGPSGRDQAGALPALVLDYVRRAGGEAGAGLSVVELRQTGEIRLKRGGLMVPVSARQWMAVGKAGFLWRAIRRAGPFTLRSVRESYVEGDGVYDARLFGVLPVAHDDGVETALSEAYRYLAELPWAPDAILGNPDLHWRMTDEGDAEVRLETRVGTARVVFRFDAQGDIVAMEARQRPARDEAGRPVHYDWRGRFGEYRDVGARRLPAYAEVGYVYPTGYEVCFRARVRDFRAVRQ